MQPELTSLPTSPATGVTYAPKEVLAACAFFTSTRTFALQVPLAIVTSMDRHKNNQGFARVYMTMLLNLIISAWCQRGG